MIAPKQVGLIEASGDLAAGGAVPLATASRIEQCRVVTIAQTTASQTATLPDPVDTSVLMSISVMNIGSADLTMYGVTISSGTSATFHWNGTAWTADVAASSSATIEVLTPTADNTVPNASTAPAAGTPQLFFVNGDHVPAGITMDAAGAITVVPATVGYNVSATDTVTVQYFT